MNISFIICCHNSAPRLAPTLAHLAALDVKPHLAWEVVLVDNASTDDTVAVAKRCWAETGAPAPLRVASQPIPGLVHARRCGLYEARHEVLCFVDDDNWVGPNWANVLDEIFTSRPDVGAAGGIGRPILEGAEPDWFSRVPWAYALGPQAPSSGEVPSARGHLYGAGLAVRRAALLDLDRKFLQPLLTGRKGRELLAGEDSELCFALTLAGWRLWYDERLAFEHFIPTYRVDIAYATAAAEGMGYASALLDAYILLGAAARPLYWRPLQQLFLSRILITLANYLKISIKESSLGCDQTFQKHLLKGRLKGIVSTRRQYRDLCQALVAGRRAVSVGGISQQLRSPKIG
jgi:glycosyltransferase involved in cell wall biosynthesis